MIRTEDTTEKARAEIVAELRFHQPQYDDLTVSRDPLEDMVTIRDDGGEICFFESAHDFRLFCEAGLALCDRLDAEITFTPEGGA